MIFLRPYWLVLLLVPLWFFWLRRKGISQNPWKKYIAPSLMPYLSVSSKIGGGRARIQWLITLVWCLLTLALAGPAVDKLPTPAVDESTPTVLLVDLNTLNPEKTKLLQVKLYEIVRQLGDNQIGLVLYDTKGYIALPLTRDKEIVNSLIPSLNASVMPSVGNDVLKGFEKADELFRNTNQKTGRILLITGGTPSLPNDLSVIRNLPYTVGVLGIGDTQTGAPIVTRNGAFLRDKKGNLILSKPDEKKLSALGIYRSSTPTGKEIAELIEATEPKALPILQSRLPKFAQALMTADVWRDLGIYFVWVALPFLVYLFRKGVFFIIVIFVLGNAMPATAGWWLRPDQESYHRIEKANQAYRAQNYQEALSVYADESGIEALYNKANALARMGQYQTAIQTYEELLQKMPGHEDGAYNKEYLEKQLQRQNQSAQNQQADSSAKNNAENKQNQAQSSQNENRAQASDTQNNATDNTASNAQSDDATASDEQDESSVGQDKSSDEQDKNKESTTQQNGAMQNEPSDKSQNTTGAPQRADEVSDKTGENQSEGNAGDDEMMTNHNNLNQSTEQQSEAKMQDSSIAQQEPDEKNKTVPNTADLSDQQSADERKGEEQKEAPKAGYEATYPPSDETDQEVQQILNRLKKDPSRVLRYRLYRQYQEN